MQSVCVVLDVLQGRKFGFLTQGSLAIYLSLRRAKTGRNVSALGITRKTGKPYRAEMHWNLYANIFLIINDRP